MNIMSLIKEHRYESVCVVLALLLLLALWPAVKLGSEAKAKARQAQELESKITRLQPRGPDGVANDLSVKVHQKLAEQMRLEAQQVARLFRDRNQRRFLIADLFPQVKDLFGFRESYNEAVNHLYEQTLNAGWPQDQSASSEPKSPADIGMYVKHDEDFGVREWAQASGAPDQEECWFGQVAFWIQQDLAQLFRDLNLASAKRMNQPPSVANATVKRILYIDIHDFYYAVELQQQLPFGLFDPGLGPGGPMGPGPGMWDPRFGGQPSFPLGPMYPGMLPQKTGKSRRRSPAKPFTERTSNDTVDVLHFSFSVIVDSRYINEFLDLFSRKNLYTILRVSLSREDVRINPRTFRKFDRTDNFNPHKDAADDFVYGTDPIVKLDIDAELLLLKELYSQDVPEQVKKSVEAQIAQEARRLRAATKPSKKKGRGRKSKQKKTPNKTEEK